MRAERKNPTNKYKGYWQWLWRDDAAGVWIGLWGGVFTYLYYLWTTIEVCRRCGREIPEDARYCPICKADQED